MIDWILVTVAAVLVIGAAVIVARFSLACDERRTAKDGSRRRRTDQESKATSLQSTIVRYELPILFALAPVVLFSSVLTVAALAVIPVIWWARWKVSGYFLPRTPLDWPVVLMMVMVPVSLLVTFDIGLSLGKVALLIYGVALYYAIVDWTWGRSRLKLAVGLYLLAGGALAVLGLLGTDWQHKAPGLSEIVSILPQIAQRLSRDQTGFHPNIVAGALLWVILPLLALAGAAWTVRRPDVYRGPGTRTGLLLLLLFMGGTFLLTQSRSALVGGAAGVGLLIWLGAPRVRLLLAALALLATAIVAIAGPAQLTGSIGDAAGPQLSTLTQADNLVVRVQVWQSALHAIADYPLTGIGVDTFRRLMPLRYPAAAVPDSYDIGHAHNQLLQAALDLGLPGLVGYLALWMVAAVLAVKSYRETTDRWQRALAAGIGAGLLASFLHGLTDAVALVSKPGVMFWGLLAIETVLWLEVRAGAGLRATDQGSGTATAEEEGDVTLSDVAAFVALRWRMYAVPVLRHGVIVTIAWWHTTALPELRNLGVALLHAIPAIMVTLLAGALRFYRLDALSLSFDEGFTLSMARMPWTAVLGLDHIQNAQPPLYYALVKVISSLGAPELTAGRLVSAVAGTLTVPVLYVLTVRLAGERLWGVVPLLASLVLALAPLHIWYSQDATPYALGALSVTFSYLALVACRQSERRAWAVAYAASVLLALYTEQSSLYALLPQVILLAASFYGWRSGPRTHNFISGQWLVAAGGIALLLFVPWLIAIGFSASGPSAQPQATTPIAVGTSLLGMSGLGMGGYGGGGEPAPWNIWSDVALRAVMVAVAIVAVVLGGIALWRRASAVGSGQDESGRLFAFGISLAVPLSLFAGTVALASLAGLLISGYSEKVVLYALAGWAILVGAAASARLPLVWRLLGGLSVVALLALSGWTTDAIYSSADKQHWRDFAEQVARATRFEWPVLTYPVNPPVTADLLDAYEPGVLSQTHMTIDPGQYHVLPSDVVQGGPDAVWFAYPESSGPGAIAAQFRQAGYRRVLSTQEWYDLSLDLYVRNGAHIGKELAINGTFEGDDESATGWQLPPTGGAIFSRSDTGGRQLTLINEKSQESIVSQDAGALPGHLYVLTFDARANMATGEAKAFLICITAKGDWPLVAPNGGGDIISNDRAWHRIDIAAICPAGTSAVRVDLRNAGLGQVDYRQVELQEAAPR